MKLESDSLKSLLIHILLLLVVLTGFVLAFFYLYLPSTTNHLETITVPNLEGLHMDEIDQFVTERNLRYEINDSTFSDEHPPLTILKQYPKPGSKVKENRKIFISINRINPPTVPVPELVDRSLRNAEAVLKSNELKRGRITYRPSQFANLVLEMQMDGEIIDQGQRIPKGSTIDLIVGDGYGQSNFPAPNLVGNDIEDVRFIILGSNLEIGIITLQGDTTGRKSIVTQQRPASGDQIRIGDAIDLWIAPVEDGGSTSDN